VRPGQAPGHAVEVIAGRLTPSFQHQLQPGGIGVRTRDFAQRQQGRIEDLPRLLRRLFRERVVGALALAARLHEVDAAQMAEMGRDARLAQVQDFLQLGDGQFLLLQQRQNAQPGRIVERLPEGAVGHFPRPVTSSYRDASMVFGAGRLGVESPTNPMDGFGCASSLKIYMSNLPVFLFLICWFGVLAWMIYRVKKFHGLAGAMFGVAVKRTVGEVHGGRSNLVGITLRVDSLEQNSADKAIGLELVAKSMGSYQLSPIALSADEARKLIGLIESALNGG
jgi:hypothetical protein